jgi:hypothetical protein
LPPASLLSTGFTAIAAISSLLSTSVTTDDATPATFSVANAIRMAAVAFTSVRIGIRMQKVMAITISANGTISNASNVISGTVPKAPGAHAGRVGRGRSCNLFVIRGLSRHLVVTNMLVQTFA